MTKASIEPSRVHEFVHDLVGEDMHAKRVLSLGNAVVGVMHAASLSIHAIGEGLERRSSSSGIGESGRPA